MRPDRAEWTGAGAALVLHAALIGALSLSLARLPGPVEPPPMEVELVDDVALTSAAPSVAQSSPPPPPSAAEPPPPSEPIAEPLPTPRVEPQPARPRVEPRRPAPARSEPQRPRQSRLDDDFLKDVPSDSVRRTNSDAAPAKPAAATFSASDLASIQQAIRRQIQPCADRQVDPGPGANRIRVTLNVRLTRSGRLVGPPRVVRTTGVDEENGRFEDRVKDLAVAAYVGCAPLTGLPPELYQTPQGGWSNINMTYRLP